MPITGNILIVDDNRSDLRLLATILSEQGHVVRPTLDGEAALISARQEQPDLILLDVRMVNMDGYTVCRELKSDKLTEDIPVIFISASNEVFDKVKALKAGSVDYITKPFEVEEVKARIDTQLKLRRLHDQLTENNEKLQRESNERQLAMQALQRARDELEHRVQERTAELDDANQRLQAEINRRQLISQDLHDHIIQSLYGSNLLLISMRKRLPANFDKSALLLLDQATLQIDQGIAEIRRFIEEHNYQSGVASFPQALADLANWAQLSDLPTISLEVNQAACDKLTEMQTMQLLAIAREAVSNCLRHSLANRAWIKLDDQNGQIVFEVGDDGIGFDLIEKHNAGKGLSNIQDRVKRIGGQLNIFTKPNDGVRIAVVLAPFATDNTLSEPLSHA